MKPGEVWRIKHDHKSGLERKEGRICVIVNHHQLASLPLKIVVPLTEWKEKYAAAAWHIPIDSSLENGLTEKSSADTFQIRSLSDKFFIEKLGTLSSGEMTRIKTGLAISLDLR